MTEPSNQVLVCALVRYAAYPFDRGGRLHLETWLIVGWGDREGRWA